MTDDLVKQLWLLDMDPENTPRQAADLIAALEAERDALAEKLERAVEKAKWQPIATAAIQEAGKDG